jgi:sulfite reductase (ferredoxin)
VGAFQSIARPLGYRCTATEVPAAIERLLEAYLEKRHANENLRLFFARHSDVELRSYLAGAPVVAVERDASPGKVPVGVSG